MGQILLIPSYDQKFYSEGIDELIDLTESKKAKLKAPKKFSFKNRNIQLPQAKTNTSIDVDPNSTPSASLTVTANPPFKTGIIDRKYVIPNDAPKSIFVTDIRNSKITTGEVEPYSIHVSHARDSVIQVNSQTSIFVENATNCLLITKSQQLRLLKVQNSKILMAYQAGTDRVVIESCSGLKIASLPFGKEVFIDDFQNPNRSKKNPNYDFMTKAEFDAIDIDQGI